MAGGTGPSAGEGMRHPLQGVGAPRQGGVTGFRLSGPGPVRLPPRGTPGSGTEAGQCLGNVNTALFLNRLSDLCWVLARFEALDVKEKERNQE